MPSIPPPDKTASPDSEKSCHGIDKRERPTDHPTVEWIDDFFVRVRLDRLGLSGDVVMDAGGPGWRRVYVSAQVGDDVGLELTGFDADGKYGWEKARGLTLNLQGKKRYRAALLIAKALVELLEKHVEEPDDE